MALTPTGLSARVFADLLANSPTAVSSLRSNPLTGVIAHNPIEAFIGALCEAVVTSTLQMTIYDLGGGTLPTGGIPPSPFPISFPTAPAGTAELVASLAWIGPYGAVMASVFVESVLLGVASLGLLTMAPHPLMGTGAGAVSAASNPGLKAAMEASLNTTLMVSFGATGKFCLGDNPVASPNTVNETLMVDLPFYASAIATGFAGIVATTAYSSPSPPGGSVAGVMNSGFIV